MPIKSVILINNVTECLESILLLLFWGNQLWYLVKMDKLVEWFTWNLGWTGFVWSIKFHRSDIMGSLGHKKPSTASTRASWILSRWALSSHVQKSDYPETISWEKISHGSIVFLHVSWAESHCLPLWGISFSRMFVQWTVLNCTNSTSLQSRGQQRGPTVVKNSGYPSLGVLS